jgi:hypothetical protein
MKISEIFKRDRTAGIADRDYMPSNQIDPMDIVEGLTNISSNDSLEEFQRNKEKLKSQKAQELKDKLSKLPRDTSSLYNPADVDSCNCHRILPGKLPENLQNEVNARAGRSQAFHRYIFDNTMSTMGSNNSQVLNRLAPDVPGGPDSEAKKNKMFVTHLLSHAASAGLTGEDLGINEEAMRNFTEHKSHLESAIPPKEDRDIHRNQKCGVCDQYKHAFDTTIANRLSAKHERETGMPGDPGDFADSAAGMSKDVYEDWKNGQPYANYKDPVKKPLYDILDNWNVHHNQTHKMGLNVLAGTALNKPINIDKIEDHEREAYENGEETPRNPKVETIYNSLLTGGNGWSIKRLEEEPRIDPFYTPEGERKIKERQPSETREDYTQRINETVPRIKKELSDVDAQGATHYYKIKTPSGRELSYVEMPGQTAVGEEGGRRYMVERHLVPYRHEYKPEESRFNTSNPDPIINRLGWNRIYNTHPEITHPELTRGINSSLPRIHKYIFQQAGIKPDTDELKHYNEAKRYHDAFGEDNARSVYGFEKPTDEMAASAHAKYYDSFHHALDKLSTTNPSESFSPEELSEHRKNNYDRLTKEWAMSARDATNAAYDRGELSAKGTTASKEAAPAGKFNSSIQNPCEKCGKYCANDVECKSNVMERRRQQAADAAFND